METLLRVENLTKFFPVKRKLFQKPANPVKAVNGLTFDIYDGETLALVGESGCGKSTTGRTLLRLLEPTSGKVTFQGRDIFTLSKEQMRQVRKHMQIIFQDPFGSLNPRLKIKDIIAEPLTAHKTGSHEQNKQRVKELMEVVGLNEEQMDRYPHEFSGGQRQRISIARALALNPKLIVCDEAVSALDVSIQSQVLNLLQELQRRFGLTYLFISHNLSVVHHIADRVGVMYLGKLVELGRVDTIYNKPAHPYTQSLLSAIPEVNPERQRERIILQGDVPSPANPPSGCHFHTRCPYVQPTCSSKVPEFREIEPGHWTACHFPLQND
ncbi:ABC transporter ATP-binding protein [Paenibacillus piri]|uniref:Dipeptide ABC transporter ATP-binding protein n=1 Tax=Paenibacillus piri TaxID=2547395 RepID=A0A4R5KBX4_9BACL|nr:dipeptide ABC transporter ATP-binding protein [Paenibacillus piri]TDF92739.1 dipeptide ABC transporter ATP-binding protein [Paenibacillus piri]